MTQKVFQVEGTGEGQSIITANGSSRDFEIIGMNGQKVSNLTGFFQNLTIAGGLAREAAG